MKHLYSVEIKVSLHGYKNFYAKDEEELKSLIAEFVEDELAFVDASFEFEIEDVHNDEGEVTNEEALDEDAYGADECLN